MPAASIEELTIADEPARWQQLGFAVQDASMRLGTVRVRLAGETAGRGITGWTLRGLRSTELDGLPTRSSERARAQPAPEQPNGVVAIDHVVVFSPSLDRTIAALQAAGLQLRRIREEPTPAGAPRQAFFRLGEVVLEAIQAPQEALARAGGPDGPARLWGLALLARDLPATVARMDGRVGEIRDAVQPGRQIATLRRSAGLAVPLALMSPAPAREASEPR